MDCPETDFVCDECVAEAFEVALADRFAAIEDHILTALRSKAIRAREDGKAAIHLRAALTELDEAWNEFIGE